MKTCFKCREEKPLNEFYRHAEMADGLLNKCKSCTKTDTKLRTERLKNDPVWYEAELDRQRVKSARVRSEGAASKVKSEHLNVYRKRHPLKRVAHQACGRAIRSGRLQRKPCEVCGDVKTHAHHDDYSKPLDVRWLCVKHHVEHHLKEKRALRATGVFKASNFAQVIA